MHTAAVTKLLRSSSGTRSEPFPELSKQHTPFCFFGLSRARPSAMTAGQRSRCSTILASVCCLVFLVSEKGQAFLTPAPSSCFQQECATSRRRSPEATATATATTTAALTHDEARAAVAATPLVPSSPPILIESLAASPGQVDDAPGQWSPVRDTGRGGRNGQRGDDEEEEDFNINVGRAMDYLAIDVKGMFSVAPRLEIFTPEVRLKV